MKKIQLTSTPNPFSLRRRGNSLSFRRGSGWGDFAFLDQTHKYNLGFKGNLIDFQDVIEIFCRKSKILLSQMGKVVNIAKSTSTVEQICV